VAVEAPGEAPNNAAKVPSLVAITSVPNSKIPFPFVSFFIT